MVFCLFKLREYAVQSFVIAVKNLLRRFDIHKKLLVLKGTSNHACACNHHDTFVEMDKIDSNSKAQAYHIKKLLKRLVQRVPLVLVLECSLDDTHPARKNHKDRHYHLPQSHTVLGSFRPSHTH